MKLVFVTYDEEDRSNENVFPFEYPSKKAFFKYVDELAAEAVKKKKALMVFRNFIPIDKVDKLKENTYTLNEWWNKFKS